MATANTGIGRCTGNSKMGRQIMSAASLVYGSTDNLSPEHREWKAKVEAKKAKKAEKAEKAAK